MKKSLIIVESPAKAKTINKFLGKDFEVMASVGHIKDLPKSSLGVDIDADFTPCYETIKGKAKVISGLVKAGKEAGAVYLAPDPDREGEAIAWHIKETLEGKDGKKIFRVLFNEITERAVKEAMAHPGQIDRNKVDAQQARRILDRLVGYQVSPLLWDKVRRGLSAGRVQSVAVRIICEREREIQGFTPREYWSIEAAFDGQPAVHDGFTARLSKKDGKKIEINIAEEAHAIVADLKGAEYKVAEVEKKERKRNPLPPFITSTLQQEAARKLSFTSKKTMMFAQNLYEGVELAEEGPVGLITYMRTDSPRLAAEAMDAARKFIKGKYGDEYLPAKPNVYRGKKSAQEAHEAIRPTDLKYTPEYVKNHLTKDQWRLYELIWKRFMASQMSPAVIDQTSAAIAARNYIFQATGAVMKFPGFTAVYEEGKDEGGEEEEGKLPPLNPGQKLDSPGVTPRQHFTQPPPRFTEATIVKELEEKGIGRPSTYSAILSTIQEREYVTKEKGRLAPTELGFLVTGLLVESFPKILDVEFTAHMEEELDGVEEGKIPWLGVMREFYGPFKESLERAKQGMKKVKGTEVPTEIVCEKCNSPMVIKWGKKGKFLACSGWPECKNTSDFTTDEKGHVQAVEKVVETGEKCPNCGKPMSVKSGRYGRFLACSDYPTCKTTKPFSTGVPCPEDGCGGALLERRTKRGRVFYGCSNYPKCKYATWDNPKKD
ncbi:MAG: type I DNA topoisomerase [Deltaproteobacteria bacterium]|nr:type I DNA topoisomerase [Deltaproteobacteria bacterium]